MRKLRYVHNLSGIRGHATANAHITEVMHTAPQLSRRAHKLRYVHNLSGIRGRATENAHITEVMHAAPACA